MRPRDSFSTFALFPNHAASRTFRLLSHLIPIRSSRSPVYHSFRPKPFPFCPSPLFGLTPSCLDPGVVFLLFFSDDPVRGLPFFFCHPLVRFPRFPTETIQLSSSPLETCCPPSPVLFRTSAPLLLACPRGAFGVSPGIFRENLLTRAFFSSDFALCGPCFFFSRQVFFLSSPFQRPVRTPDTKLARRLIDNIPRRLFFFSFCANFFGPYALRSPLFFFFSPFPPLPHPDIPHPFLQQP